MVIVKPEKLRKYKKENRATDNILHKSAKKKAKKIAARFKLKLTEEAIFNPYIIDLYSPEMKIGFEIDGGIHNKTQDYDYRRDTFLYEQYKILILRFNADEIKNGIFKTAIWACCYKWLLKHIEEINIIALANNQKDAIPKVLRQFIV